MVGDPTHFRSSHPCLDITPPMWPWLNLMVPFLVLSGDVDYVSSVAVFFSLVYMIFPVP